MSAFIRCFCLTSASWRTRVKFDCPLKINATFWSRPPAIRLKGRIPQSRGLYTRALDLSYPLRSKSSPTVLIADGVVFRDCTHGALPAAHDAKPAARNCAELCICVVFRDPARGPSPCLPLMTPNQPQFRERYGSRDGKDLGVVRPVVNKTSTNYFLGCCILVTVRVDNPSRPGRVSGGGNMHMCLSIPLVTRSKCNVALLFVLLIGLINDNSHQASAQTGEGLLAVHMHIHFTTIQS